MSTMRYLTTVLLAITGRHSNIVVRFSNVSLRWIWHLNNEIINFSVRFFFKCASAYWWRRCRWLLSNNRPMTTKSDEGNLSVFSFPVRVECSGNSTACRSGKPSTYVCLSVCLHEYVCLSVHHTRSSKLRLVHSTSSNGMSAYTSSRKR